MPNPSVSPLTAADQAAAENATRQFPDLTEPHATGPTAVQVCLWKPCTWNGRPGIEFYARKLTSALAGLGADVVSCHSPAFADMWFDQSDLRHWLEELDPTERARMDDEGWNIGVIRLQALAFSYPFESLTDGN